MCILLRFQLYQQRTVLGTVGPVQTFTGPTKALEQVNQQDLLVARKSTGRPFHIYLVSSVRFLDEPVSLRGQVNHANASISLMVDAMYAAPFRQSVDCCGDRTCGEINLSSDNVNRQRSLAEPYFQDTKIRVTQPQAPLLASAAASNARKIFQTTSNTCVPSVFACCCTEFDMAEIVEP